ncbi:MAG: PilW family protein [Desulfocapsaceae bacterium]|nr:PilW family protein [Desulfocapsaceae bacterium]
MEQHGKTLRRGESGFSLVELILYMALLGIMMAMVFSSFIPVMQTSSQQWRVGETKIETGVGLELLRADLEHAGFGLPWMFPAGVVPDPYFEPVAPVAPATTNDALTKAVPRALSSEDATAIGLNNGSDYLAIKALNVARGVTGQKWGWLGRDAAHLASPQSLGVDPFDVANDWVIVIRTEVSPGENRQLVLDGAGLNNFYAKPTSIALDAFAPPATANDPDGERYILYGLVDNNPVVAPRRPFNRTDYYVNNAANAAVSAHCAPGTGTLSKAVLNQSDNNFDDILPIVDCVADFQVVYYLDTNGDGGVDARANASGLAGMTAQQIRTQVKAMRCYVLTHEGGIDRTYTYGLPTINVGEVAADGVTLQANAGRTFDVSTLPNIGLTWVNYHWKVYSLAVTPRNLQ